jgi:hypothetical protein
MLICCCGLATGICQRLSIKIFVLTYTRIREFSYHHGNTGTGYIGLFMLFISLERQLCDQIALKLDTKNELQSFVIQSC